MLATPLETATLPPGIRSRFVRGVNGLDIHILEAGYAPAGRPLVPLAPLVAAKAELYRTMRRAGITKAELARRIGISPQQAQRLFDIHHASRLDQIESAMRALGRRLIVTSGAA